MRLWHNDLIELLPQKQLLGQWRELNCIYRQKNRHILINFVYEYPKLDLYCYSLKVIEEMHCRGYKVNTNNFDLNFMEYAECPADYVPFKEKMNKTYLRICLMNLYEKYLCKGISENEWNKIYTANKLIIDSMV